MPKVKLSKEDRDHIRISLKCRLSRINEGVETATKKERKTMKRIIKKVS